MIKPQNCVPSIKDKVLNSGIIDFSASNNTVNLGVPGVGIDPDHDWEVCEVTVIMQEAYIVSQPVVLDVGQSIGPSGAADTDKFVDAQSLGAVAIAAGVESDPVTQTATKVLPAGHFVMVAHVQNDGQTGTGIVCVRLRPQELARGNASKRGAATPKHANADAPS